MQHIFTHKKILICISGSIAVYKMLDCISQLYKYGAQIKVIMSAEAVKFVNPLSFEALSRNIVLSEANQTWASESIEGVNHIAYAKWADIVLIAPATANSIAKIACGIADSAMLGAILATSAPKILAPAMNTAMLNAPQTQRNLATLASMGYEIIPTRVSLLACGEQNDGALAEIDEMIFYLARVLTKISTKSTFWQDREVIVSGGGSKESIDCVRYLSNHSSGKQASALSLALFMLGAKVTFISSATPIKLPLDIQCVSAQDGASFDTAIHTTLEAFKAQKKPVLFMAAALADYAPKKQEGKLKKEHIGEELILHCHKTKDVLAHIDAHTIYKVGFKAEIDDIHALEYATHMLHSKQCQMVCLNVINEQNPFGGENNAFKLITHKGIEKISGSKFEVALHIALSLESLLEDSKPIIH